jgi:hypothetical protein
MAGAETQCLRCRKAARSAGLLCESCARALTPAALILPRHIEGLAVPATAGDAWLVDCWGRPHPTGDAFLPGTIGRDGDMLRLLTGVVSRQHIELGRPDGKWLVRDLKSRNGSSLNGKPLDDAHHPIASGDTLHLADVGFVFIAGPLASVEVEPAGIRTQTLMASTGGGSAALKLHENPMGGGGVLELGDGRTFDLPLMQLELLQPLVAEWRKDPTASPEVRGFVGSGFIITSLSWDTSDPTSDHLKQLIRRTRQQLEGTGLVLEGRHGAGYRLVAG